MHKSKYNMSSSYNLFLNSVICHTDYKISGPILLYIIPLSLPSQIGKFKLIYGNYIAVNVIQYQCFSASPPHLAHTLQD